MDAMNVWIITGNLGKDAEVRDAGGTPVAGFSVATKAGYGQKEQTIWVDCSLWGKRAESGLIQYLKKGQQVCVSGELGTREYNDKTYITLKVAEIDLIGGKQTERRQESAGGGNSSDDLGDDIPF
jgi:single-strand DNA-binding protein